VTFKPTATGSRTAAVTIADNAPNSPQSLALTGNGTDFSVGATTSTASVSAGQSTNYALSVNPVAAFTGDVTLSCTGAPAAATCTTPGSVAVNGSAASVSVTVSTTARGMLTPPVSSPFGPLAQRLLLVLGMLILSVLAGTKIARTRVPRHAWVGGSALVVLSLSVLISGCSAIVQSSNPPPVTGTPAGTYTLTVTAGSQGVTHSTKLTLTVN
jgi:hypothetical protein